jgi:hypothetical protein
MVYSSHKYNKCESIKCIAEACTGFAYRASNTMGNKETMQVTHAQLQLTTVNRC